MHMCASQLFKCQYTLQLNVLRHGIWNLTATRRNASRSRTCGFLRSSAARLCDMKSSQMARNTASSFNGPRDGMLPLNAFSHCTRASAASTAAMDERQVQVLAKHSPDAILDVGTEGRLRLGISRL